MKKKEVREFFNREIAEAQKTSDFWGSVRNISIALLVLLFVGLLYSKLGII